MFQLVFATNNQHKVDEIKSLLQNRFDVITLKEAGIDIDIPEPFNTLEENATQKATVINNLTGKDCFSEDTGLEVEALNGEPGVRSARYAGDEANNENNIKKLLANLKDVQIRNARFRTVVSLILNKKEFQFEGICTGTITKEAIGTNGFGYDAVFIPDGSTKTFAEMTMEEKSIYSHRKKATSKLIDFLNIYNGES